MLDQKKILTSGFPYWLSEIENRFVVSTGLTQQENGWSTNLVLFVSDVDRLPYLARNHLLVLAKNVLVKEKAQPADLLLPEMRVRVSRDRQFFCEIGLLEGTIEEVYLAADNQITEKCVACEG